MRTQELKGGILLLTSRAGAWISEVRAQSNGAWIFQGGELNRWCAVWLVRMLPGPTLHRAWIPDAEQLTDVLEGLRVAGAGWEC